VTIFDGGAYASLFVNILKRISAIYHSTISSELTFENLHQRRLRKLLDADFACVYRVVATLDKVRAQKSPICWLKRPVVLAQNSLIFWPKSLNTRKSLVASFACVYPIVAPVLFPAKEPCNAGLFCRKIPTL